MNINATLIGQFITFAILVWFSMRYVWPPIIKSMHEREKKIADGINAAERSQYELTLAREEAKEILIQAKKEAQKIIDSARNDSAKILSESKLQSLNEHKRIIDLAKEEINRELNRNREEFRKNIASLAIAAAEKLIGKKIDDDSQLQILNDFIAEI